MVFLFTLRNAPSWKRSFRTRKVVAMGVVGSGLWR